MKMIFFAKFSMRCNAKNGCLKQIRNLIVLIVRNFELQCKLDRKVIFDKTDYHDKK
jgi:hypothetical protein